MTPQKLRMLPINAQGGAGPVVACLADLVVLLCVGDVQVAAMRLLVVLLTRKALCLVYMRLEAVLVLIAAAGEHSAYAESTMPSTSATCARAIVPYDHGHSTTGNCLHTHSSNQATSADRTRS